MKETSTERFDRLAEARTNAILDKIRLLGQCSNRNNYSYTDAQVQQIFRVLEKELRRTKDLFSHAGHEKRKFRLDR